tara:strand:+ start:813 stop:1724 length:912 start_codon:yes stop_codon:yes gene_type:complete
MYPKYITLLWENIRNYSVKYTEKPILSCQYYITEVHLRKINTNVKIYGKIKSNWCKLHNSKLKFKGFKSVSFLKSNIQKAVRLGKIDEALCSSYNLINLDFNGFIRRLITICIEDVGITSTLPFMTWLMMAHSNIELTNEFIKLLLLTVYGICKHNIKHLPDNSCTELDYEKYDFNNPIINSLIIASEYGGFKGDVQLFNTFINNKNIFIIDIPIKNLVLTRNITKKDIIQSAVDFHCYPHIIQQIAKQTGIKGDTIKKLIWLNSSSINYRVYHNITEKPIWNIINKIYNNLQNQIIQNLYIA